ncbi:hypothetical protein LTR93_011317, partial [Exophiala xenobiotica]
LEEIVEKGFQELETHKDNRVKIVVTPKRELLDTEHSSVDLTSLTDDQEKTMVLC